MKRKIISLFPLVDLWVSKWFAHSSLLAAFFFLPASASTPGFDTLVNYDTAWTFTYDGGKFAGNSPVPDILYDVKVLSDKSAICVGETRDTSGMRNLILLHLDENGKQ